MKRLQKNADSGSEISKVTDYLIDFDLFKGKEQEGLNYINDALQRFLVTLELIPKGSKNQIAGVGSEPIFHDFIDEKISEL